MFEDNNDESFSLDKVVLFERMIESDSFSFFDVDEYETIINYYLDVELKDKAKLATLKGLEHHPKNLSLSLILVEFYSIEKKYISAIELLKSILPLNPFNGELLLTLGRLNSRQGYYNSADLNFRKALKMSFEDREGVLMELAYEYQNMGNCDRAIDVMKELLLINPENESTILELGVAYNEVHSCLLYTSPSPRDVGISRMPSSA